MRWENKLKIISRQKLQSEIKYKNSFFKTTKFFFKARNFNEIKYYWQTSWYSMRSFKNFKPKGNGGNIIDVNSDGTNGIV